jgi:hypothetical protein
MAAEGEERRQAPAMRVAVAQDGVALLSLWREAETVPGHTDDLQSIDRLMRHDSNAERVRFVKG